MNSVLSLGLIAGLMISTSAVAAEERGEPPASVHIPVVTPQVAIGEAIATEALRFNAERLPRRLPSPQLDRTWRHVGTGALIGFGAGAVLGMTVGQEACLNEPRWHCAKVGLPFAAIGAVVAWLRR
jgi:hypothetical protein